jgi:hypothetical protein
MLTGGTGLPERERREMEGVESLTGGAGLSAEARAREAGPPGPGERGGQARAWRGLGQNWPSRGGEGFFLFLFSISFHFIFYFCFFLFLFSFESKIF